MATDGVISCDVCQAPIHLEYGKWMTKWRGGRKVTICRRCDRTGAWQTAGLRDDAPLTGTAVARAANPVDRRIGRRPDLEPAKKEDAIMPRSFVCLDCKKECAAPSVGILPKRCEPCKKNHLSKMAAERYAHKHGRRYALRKCARKPLGKPGSGDLGEMLDARIREVCEHTLVIGKDVVEGVVKEVLGECLPDLVDARIREVFSGRVKA